MKFVDMLKKLIAAASGSETAETRSIAIILWKAHQFSEEELRGAGTQRADCVLRKAKISKHTSHSQRCIQSLL